MFKGFLLKACAAGLAALALGGASGLLRAQQADARRQDGTETQGAEARVAALRSPDALKRAAAAWELSQRPAEARAALEVLLGLLGDAAPVDPRAYRKQESRNFPHTNTTVGREAAAALAAVGAETVGPLIAALGRREDEARRNAAWALGAAGDRRAVEPLTKTLGGDADVHTREQAAWALGALGDRGATEALARALSDESDEVREQAAWASGAVGDRRSVGPLVAALKDPHSDVRMQAAWALGAIGDPSAVERLSAALKDIDAEVRTQAAWALGAIGDPRAAGVLRAATRDKDSNVREQARWALGVVAGVDWKKN